MLKEFKEFAMRGNVMDLAIGIIIGGAFQKIVNSLVNDIIMPAISILTGKVDFSNLTIAMGEISINYGTFITTIVNFIIIAFSVFLLVRYINNLNAKLNEIPTYEFDKKSKKLVKKKKAKAVEPEPTTKICPFCYSEINIKATRCPNCTSKLENIAENNDITNSNLEKSNEK